MPDAVEGFLSIEKCYEGGLPAESVQFDYELLNVCSIMQTFAYLHIAKN